MSGMPMLPGNIRPLRRATTMNRRWPTSVLAVLQTRSRHIPCTIENVSRGGARLIVGHAPIGDEEVTLIVPDFGEISARLAWRRRDRVGVQFAPGQLWVVDLMKKAGSDEVPLRSR
jgi:hypothetical protein